MRSSLLPARARRSLSPRDARCPGARTRQPSMMLSVQRWAAPGDRRGRRRSGRHGRAGRQPCRRPGARRRPAREQRDRRDPARRRNCRSGVRGAGSLLLVDCAQSAGKLPLPDADFISISGAQVRRAARLRRAAGARHRRPAGERWAGAGLSPRNRELAGRSGHGGRARRRAFAEASPRIAELRRKLEAECSLGRNRHRRRRASGAPSSALCDAGRRQRQPARAARPRGDFGVGGQRLFVRQHEAQPGARRDGRRRPRSRARHPGKLRPGNQRRGHRPLLIEWRRIAERSSARAA